MDHLSFEVQPGRVTGFLGPNGAGKSTTLRMILGLDNPTSGTALVNGRSFAYHHNPLSEVGALLDPKAFHPGRSARNHLRCLALANGIDPRRAEEVLDVVGLTSVASKRAGGFSLGMGQRLGIASALLGDPAILILDEPVNGLDPDGVLWIRTLLRSLAAEGRTVLVSSHLMSEMALTAEHLVVIGQGRLLADDSVDAVIASRGQNSVRVRSPQSEQLAALLTARGAVRPAQRRASSPSPASPPTSIGDLAAANHITIHELSLQQVSLEEAFMELTHDSVQYRTNPPTPPRKRSLTMTDIAVLHRPTRRDHRRPSPSVLPNLLRSEWAKLRSVRSTYWSVPCRRRRHDRDRSRRRHRRARAPPSRPPSTRYRPAIGGFVLAQLALGVLGVLAVTSEYSTGMIRTTFTAAPQRGTVIAAKAAVFGAASFVVGAVVSLFTFLVGQAILGDRGSASAPPARSGPFSASASTSASSASSPSASAPSSDAAPARSPSSSDCSSSSPHWLPTAARLDPRHGRQAPALQRRPGHLQDRQRPPDPLGPARPGRVRPLRRRRPHHRHRPRPTPRRLTPATPHRRYSDARPTNAAAGAAQAGASGRSESARSPACTPIAISSSRKATYHSSMMTCPEPCRSHPLPHPARRTRCLRHRRCRPSPARARQGG